MLALYASEAIDSEEISLFLVGAFPSDGWRRVVESCTSPSYSASRTAFKSYNSYSILRGGFECGRKAGVEARDSLEARFCFSALHYHLQNCQVHPGLNPACVSHLESVGDEANTIRQGVMAKRIIQWPTGPIRTAFCQ
jgi:hypothetical protein